jgi:hypothetical protein
VSSKSSSTQVCTTRVRPPKRLTRAECRLLQVWFGSPHRYRSCWTAGTQTSRPPASEFPGSKVFEGFQALHAVLRKACSSGAWLSSSA